MKESSPKDKFMLKPKAQRAMRHVCFIWKISMNGNFVRKHDEIKGRKIYEKLTRGFNHRFSLQLFFVSFSFSCTDP